MSPSASILFESLDDVDSIDAEWRRPVVSDGGGVALRTLVATGAGNGGGGSAPLWLAGRTVIMRFQELATIMSVT